MAVSFIGGGNRTSRRKPPTYRKSLTNFITVLYRVHLEWTGIELTTLVVIGTDGLGSFKSNDHDHDGPTNLRDLLCIKLWTEQQYIHFVCV